MENYFIFNGIDSRTLGVRCGIIEEFVFPKKRMESITIEGRNGTLTESDNCYESTVRTIECYCENQSLEQIAIWLNGIGKMRFSNDLDKVWDVKITNAIALEIVATYWRNFPLILEIQPLNYSYTEYIEEISERAEFDAGGTVETEPILEIECTGNVNISINNKNTNITNGNGLILIDTKFMIMTENGINASQKISGDLLNEIKLKPYGNIVEINGDYTSFKIKYRRANLC